MDLIHGPLLSPGRDKRPARPAPEARTPKRRRSEDAVVRMETGDDFSTTGPCAGCGQYYGVAGNSGRCSRCFAGTGTVYEGVAMEHARRECIAAEIDSSLGDRLLQPAHLHALADWFARGPARCARAVYGVLASTCTPGPVLLRASQAALLCDRLRQASRLCCDIDAAVVYVKARVFDAWNLQEWDDMPWPRLVRPVDRGSLVEQMDARWAAMCRASCTNCGAM